MEEEEVSGVLAKEVPGRKLIHFNVTEYATLEWTKQQVRNACFEEQPKFLLHDNDGKFGQLGRLQGVDSAGKRISCRSTFDAWLWRVMGIRGIPIPYGAPNAAAHIERLIGTLRRECFDRMLIWNERHLRCSRLFILNVTSTNRCVRHVLCYNLVKATI